MTNKERQKARELSTIHFYEGNCLRCDKKSPYIYKDYDMCSGCTEHHEEMIFRDRQNTLPDPSDKEGMFRHEKSQQGWDNSMDEEIWNNHFRY